MKKRKLRTPEMKPIIKLITLSILFFLLSCGPSEKASEKKETEGNKKTDSKRNEPRLEVDYKKSNFREGTVIDQSGLAGCTYIIELDDGKKIQPVNLDPEFSRHNLAVWVKYKLKDTPSTCMVGKVAIIEAIELKTENE